MSLLDIFNKDQNMSESFIYLLWIFFIIDIFENMRISQIYQFVKSSFK